jgi:O-antigen/teichoic acid export membrane protein
VVLTHLLIGQKPRLRYKKEIAGKIFHNTNWLNGISILDYLSKNIDDLIIGKLLGTSTLGVYRNSYAVTHSATAELGVSLIYTTFPIFSKVQQDLARLKKAFISSTIGFALFLLIPVLILLLFPTVIIQIALGPGWLEALVVLPALAVAGYLQGLINTSSALLTVTRSYRELMKILGFSLVSMVVLLLVLIPQVGFWGAGISVVLSRLMTMPLVWWSVRKVLHEQA